MKPCPGCHGTVGPYVDSIGAVSKGPTFPSNNKYQVICSTCGMRGPFSRPDVETAEEAWDRLPR